MELLPKDLGIRRQVALTLLRSSELSGQYAAQMSAPQVVSQAEVFRTAYTDMGRMARDVSAKVSANPNEKLTTNPFTRAYMSVMDMPPQAAQQVISTQGGLIGGLAGGFGGGFGGGFMIPALMMFLVGKAKILPLAVVFFMLGLFGLIFGLVWPALLLRKWSSKALTTSEVALLVNATKEDILEQEYLHLVQDALLFVPSNERTAKELKEAIRSLGEAIDRLPPARTVSVNVAELQADLERVLADAQNEQDAVIRESLNRRANAIRQSLQGAKRSERNNRRADALREELVAQVRALRISLSDRYERSEDSIQLDGLADSMSRINREADAIADAELELEEALAEPRTTTASSTNWNTPAEEQPQVVHVSRQ